MKDIKSLYEAAKSSGNNEDLTAYTDAVKELLEYKPAEFLSNLKYIIKSNISCTKLDEFVEKYGLSITSYYPIVESLMECIDLCKKQHIDSSIYESYLEKFNMFKSQYQNCFNMFEYYSTDDVSRYNKAYYSFNEKGIQNNKLIAGMINEFGEIAIADAFITADRINSTAVKQLLEYTLNNFDNKLLSQWITECCKDLDKTCIELNKDLIESNNYNNLTNYFEAMNEGHTAYIRESMLMGDIEAVTESSDLLTFQDIAVINDLISFKEYMITCTESEDLRDKLQKEIYSLYEQFNGLEDEDLYMETSNQSTNTSYLTDQELIESLESQFEDLMIEIDSGINYYIEGNNNHGIDEFKQRWNYDEQKQTIKHDGREFKIDLYTDIETIDTNLLIFNNKLRINMEKPIAAVFPNAGDPKIVINKNLWNHSVETQDVIILHEIGHYIYHVSPRPFPRSIKEFIERIKRAIKRLMLHLKMKKYTKGVHGNPYQELEADAYAARKIKDPEKLIKGLRSLYADEDEVDRQVKEYGKQYDPIIKLNYKKELRKNPNLSYEEYKKSYLQNIKDLAFNNLNNSELNPDYKNRVNAIRNGKFQDKSYFKTVQTESSDSFTEDMSWRNTRNKKTGNAPSYLSTNHNLGYNEDDDKEEKEPSIEDFKRKSNSNNTDIDDEDKSNTLDSELDKDPEVKSNITPEDQKAINNYYYYTYNNSMNKNSNSFNKADDHSVDNRKSDDHSTGKNINSHNGNNRGNNGDNRDNNNHNESKNMFSLDIGGNNSFFDESTSEYVNEFASAYFNEAVGDADDNKPESDHPVRDILQDIDRSRVKTQQSMKKKVQDATNVVRAATKPINRTKSWLMNTVNDWKDKDENAIKEKMADPKARKNLFTAISTAIKAGSLLKAGLLLNPVFLALTALRKVSKHKDQQRLRDEMIGELKTELEVIDEKIQDARNNGDNKQKYQLIRLRNEINKKLVRVSGSVSNKKWIGGKIV